MSELKRDQARKSEIKPEDIEIFCKKCTRLLSRASDMLKKGSQYICISEEFQEKIEKRSGKKEDFRLDQIVGEYEEACYCLTCGRFIVELKVWGGTHTV